jgi:hypothetical protein
MNTGTGQPAASGGFGPDSTRTEPTEAQRAAAAVLRMIWGIHISRAVYVAAELGLADRLAARPVTSAELAQATQTHEPSLYRVLGVLAALDVLSEHGDRWFRLTILGSGSSPMCRPPCGRGRCWSNPSAVFGRSSPSAKPSGRERLASISPAG